MLAALPALYPPTHCHLSGTPTLLSSPSGKWDSSSAGHCQDKSLAKIQGAPWIESGAEKQHLLFLDTAEALQQPFVFLFLQFPGRSDGQLGADPECDSVWAPAPRQGAVNGQNNPKSGVVRVTCCFASPPGPWFSAAAPSAPLLMHLFRESKDGLGWKGP